MKSVYHYSAKVDNADIDGVFDTEGEIATMEDYRKLKEAIAKKQNVSVERMTIVSLSKIAVFKQ